MKNLFLVGERPQSRLTALAIKTTLATGLAAALLAGCGGGGGGGTAEAAGPETPPANIGDSVAAMVEYINTLVARTSDTTDPVEVNAVTLAIDDGAEPTPLP